VGFGLDAHSMLLMGAGAVRFANADDLDAYLDDADMPDPFGLRQVSRAVSAPEADVIGRDEAFEEALFLGLRLNEGVSLTELRDQFGDGMVGDAVPALREVEDAGLLEVLPDRVRLTSRGRMVSNEVFSRLLVPATV
jgi:oxygen-independent coproporphyrinogen-3 oxidase